MRPVILDGHNDLALRVWQGQEPRHIDLASAGEAASRAGSSRSRPRGAAELRGRPLRAAARRADRRDEARAAVDGMLGALEGLDVCVVRGSRRSLPGRVNAIVHLEGAEPLAPDLSDLEHGTSAGCARSGSPGRGRTRSARACRSVSRRSPDTGPGLTEAGLDLVHACNLLGHPRRRLASERGRLLGRRPAHPGADRRDPLERARALRRRRGTSPTGSSTRSASRAGSSASTSPSCSCARTAASRRRARSTRSCGTSTTSPRGSASITSRSARTSRAPRSRTSSAAIAGLPRLVEALARGRLRRGEALAKITHRNWLRVLGDDLAALGALLPAAGLDPRPTLLDAVARFAAPGFAVDLGAGTGRDTLELLRRGWRVLAIDREAGGDRAARELAGADADRLETEGRPGSSEAAWPACELVNASFALPFCPPGRVPGALAADRRLDPSRRPLRRPVLRPERRLGPHGAARCTPARSSSELLRAVRGRAARRVRGRDGPTAIGKSKHWHLYHVVARKR